MADTETKYLNVALTPAENDEVRELAVKERRRPSLMGAVLIAEALAARRTPPRPHRRKPTLGEGVALPDGKAGDTVEVRFE